MNTPLVWIFIPLLIGFILLFFQQKSNVVFASGVFLTTLLAITALLIPFEEIVIFGNQSISLENEINLVGLQIFLTNQIRPIIILFYAYLALLFAGSFAAKAHRNFIPISLIINSLILAGIATKPIILGLLFFLPAGFISIFLFIPAGSRFVNGTMRFIVFQVMGILFLLLAGFSLSTGTVNVDNTEVLQRALLLFWIGFSFLMAIFPLHTWVTMLAENVHPYAASFVFAILFGGYSFLIISIINTYLAALSSDVIVTVLQIAGFALIVSGGIGAAIQKNIGRLFGFAVLIEIGYSLLAISTNIPDLFFNMLLPKVFSLSVWSMGLSIVFMNTRDLSFQSVVGRGLKLPFACTATLIAQFSLSGVPLLAGFPVLLAVWREISSLSTILVIWVFIGSLGLLVGSLRSFSMLMTVEQEMDWRGEEDNVQKVYLLAGMIFLVLMGIFPHWIHLFISRLVEGVEMLSL